MKNSMQSLLHVCSFENVNQSVAQRNVCVQDFHNICFDVWKEMCVRFVSNPQVARVSLRLWCGKIPKKAKHIHIIIQAATEFNVVFTVHVYARKTFSLFGGTCAVVQKCS